jgi:hypothetical protein
MKTKLTSEKRRALRLLARHPNGCGEAILLKAGCSVGQLVVLMIDGLATVERRHAYVRRRETTVMWMQITDEGRQAIAE